MKKILLIEDEEIIRETIYELLTEENFEVLPAENGTIGTNLALSQNPDLIICDIMMPEISGYEVLNTLRGNKQTAITPFIFLTAKITTNDIRYGMELGADDYLSKPFSREKLLRAIASRLQKQEVLLQHYFQESQRVKELEEKLQIAQEISESKDKILEEFKHGLREVVSKINMSLFLFANAPEEKKVQYLSIIKMEMGKEIELLNSMESLHKFINPENLALLRDYKILK